MILYRKSQIIRGIYCCLLAAILFYGICGSVLAKPTPPLDLHISRSTQLDGKIKIKLTATAQMETASVELSLGLPESVAIVEGSKKWAGSLAIGEKKTIMVLIQKVSTTPGEVIGEGTVYFKEGGSFTQQNNIQINKEPNRSLLPRTLSPSIQQRRGKGTILEHKGF